MRRFWKKLQPVDIKKKKKQFLSRATKSGEGKLEEVEDEVEDVVEKEGWKED